jgi:hypothetical protein
VRDKSVTYNLLLGAGFSRNWGGWLANEVNEYLLGDANLPKSLKEEILCGGGFEVVLGKLQSPGSAIDHLTALLSALEEMFKAMNTSLLTTQFQFDQDYRLRRFLAKFDAIFALNQDLLLEKHYVAPNFDISINCVDRWNSVVRPGLPPIEIEAYGGYTIKTLTSNIDTSIPKQAQPYFKLHGTSDVRSDNGVGLLILGARKDAQISNHTLLSFYRGEFLQRLSTGNARLMVIGYSFQDLHIDNIIWDCCRNHGLQVFVIDPMGTNVINKQNENNPIEKFGKRFREIAPSLIGASRRGLNEIFGNDMVEHDKVMRFFA